VLYRIISDHLGDAWVTNTMNFCFKHIVFDNDEYGTAVFDKYFDYIESIKNTMPKALSEFASNYERYELNGPLTLHDSWIDSIFLQKNYFDVNAIKQSTVKLKFLLANQNLLDLQYEDVSEFIYTYQPTKWPDRAVDLIVHEFDRNDDGSYSHLMAFDRNVWLKIVFKTFQYEDIQA